MSKIKENNLSGDILCNDLIRHILNMRRDLMLNDKYKNNKIKLISEFNMINNVITNFNDKTEYDKVMTGDYHYEDYKTDYINDYITENILNDYYINKISYNQIKEIITDALEEGFYFYEVNAICEADNVLSQFTDTTISKNNPEGSIPYINEFISDYDYDLTDFFENNRKTIYLMLKKILYNYKSDNDIIKNILNHKDYYELMEL